MASALIFNSSLSAIMPFPYRKRTLNNNAMNGFTSVHHLQKFPSWLIALAILFSLGFVIGAFFVWRSYKRQKCLEVEENRLNKPFTQRHLETLRAWMILAPAPTHQSKRLADYHSEVSGAPTLQYAHGRTGAHFSHYMKKKSGTNTKDNKRNAQSSNVQHSEWIQQPQHGGPRTFDARNPYDHPANHREWALP